MVDAQRPKVIFPLRVKELQIQNNKDLFPVGKIYCVGKNYEDHAEEMGGNIDVDQPFFLASRHKPLRNLHPFNSPHKQKTFIMKWSLLFSCALNV